MDSSVSPTHGDQEMSVWNGHYACACYHPLFVFNQFGDLERSALRPGNVHSADGWDGVLKPVVARYQSKVSRIYFRADAAFAMPEVYEFLEAERIKYAIRLPANQILQHRIGYLLKRPVGRPSNDVRRFHANFTYQLSQHACNTGADQQLVADELEGEADHPTLRQSCSKAGKARIFSLVWESSGESRFKDLADSLLSSKSGG